MGKYEGTGQGLLEGDDGIVDPAAGLGDAVFEELEVFPEPVLQAWYGLYTTGERRYYDALVGA